MQTLTETGKKALFGLLRAPFVNRWMVRPLRRFPRLMSLPYVKRFPIVGQISTQGFGLPEILFESDGRDSIATLMYWSGLERFEPETIPVFLAFANRSKVVLDIGANSGIYSLITAASRNPGQVIYCFEPIPEIFRALKNNAEINHFSSIVPICAALTDYDGEIELYLPKDLAFPTSSSTMKGFREAGKVLTCRACKLDTFAAQAGIQAVDLLKIDTEATEPAVLVGASQVLRNYRPWIVSEVLMGKTEAALERQLGPLGYQYFLITPHGLTRKRNIAGDAKCGNYAFIPEEAVDEAVSMVEALSGVH